MPRPKQKRVIKDDNNSHQTMKTEHAQERKSLALRRSSRLSPNSEDQECLPDCAPAIVSRDTFGRIQRDSTDARAGAANDEVVSIENSTHYLSNRREAAVEVLPFKAEKRDDKLQVKVIPHYGEAGGNCRKREQDPISPMCFNEHTRTTSLPGIETFQPDIWIDQKRKHDIQDFSSGIGLRELHERSLQPWSTYRTATCTEVSAQLLSVTKDVAQLNTKAGYFSLYEAT
jgi:hypothetical protein